MTIDAVDGEYAQIDGAFAALVMHSKLMPFGMDRPEWLHGFSSRQKRQWIQFAINLSRLPLGVDGSVWEIVREAVRKEPPPEAHPDLPEPPSTFAAYLKRLRTERGLSLRDVAADLDVTYRDLRAWEHAQWFPRRPGSAFLMQRIAMIFDQRTEDVHREAGFDGERVDEMASSIATAFRALALHPDLMPIGMDDRGWLDSFSTRQKRQWVEFAHRLQWLLDGLPDGEDRAGVIRLIEGIQGSQNG